MASEAQEIIDQLLAKMKTERCFDILISMNTLIDSIEADPDNDQLWQEAQQYL